MLKKIERYFISPIHPKLEIRRNIVASINELGETAAKKGGDAKTKTTEAHQVQRFIKGG